MLTTFNKLFRVSTVSLVLFTSCNDGGGDYSPSLSSEADGAVTVTTPSTPGGGNNGPSAGLITAGEWNDLANWPFWEELKQQQAYSAELTRWGFDTGNRFITRLNFSMTCWSGWWESGRKSELRLSGISSF